MFGVGVGKASDPDAPSPGQMPPDPTGQYIKKMFLYVSSEIKYRPVPKKRPVYKIGRYLKNTVGNDNDTPAG